MTRFWSCIICTTLSCILSISAAIDAPLAQERQDALWSRDLIEACRATMRGEPFLYPAAVRALVRDYLDRASRGEATPEDPLTPRELEVVKLIAEGLTSEVISEQLFISKKTVDRHRANVLEKLGMRNRVELTRYAIRRGLVEP